MGHIFRAKSLAQLAFIATISIFAANCSYKTPPKESPAPTDVRVAKTFFADFDESGNVAKYKTFACSWTPEKVAGKWGTEVFAFYNHADHCNIIFKITKDALLGKLINPSFPDDPDRWPNVITIPITKHYHYEQAVDKYNRKTNKVIENSDKDDWSARPYISIDPAGIKINDWAYDIFWDTHVVDSVSDVEWDMSNNFLGFTIEAHSAFYGSRMQGKFRFNFLAFESDPTFVKTPYNPENSRYLNVLHVLGEQVNGNRQILSAAHWDTRKQQTIYLNNFPTDLVDVAKDVIEDWNTEFEKIGHGRPFRTEVRQGKYAIDLRYPGITWVSDKQLSLNAPLGVGMANADVKNGKILWGGVTIWGGMLERIVNSYSPALHATGMTSEGMTEYSEPVVQLSLMEPESPIGFNKPAFPDELRQTLPAGNVREAMRVSLLKKHNAAQAIDAMIPATEKVSPEARAQVIRDLLASPRPGEPNENAPREIKEFAKAARAKLKALHPLLDPDSNELDSFTQDYGKVQSRLQALAASRGNTRDFLNADFLQGLIEQPTLAQSLKGFPTQNARQLKHVVEDGARLSKADLRMQLEKTQSAKAYHMTFDVDRRLSDVAYQWNAGLAKSGVNKTLALRAFVKDLLLHEVGHMLGMGHNFKENVLPVKGEVPAEYIKDLTAKAKDNFKNYSTVMGYKNGLTDVITRYEELRPGPNDALVLNYLYNRQYPVFPVDAKDTDKFDFVTLDPKGDGIMEGEQTVKGRTQRVAFFPSCNDLDASYGKDPFCNRWDRGSDAVSIVDGYFEDYRGMLSSQLYSFANNLQGRNHWYQQYYLWAQSLRTFGRARLFYDYMRQKYEGTLAEMQNVGGQQRIQNMLEFSQACRGQTQNRSLLEMFARPENKELKDLCIATGNMFEQLQIVLELPGPDSTKLDYFDSYATGGIFGGDARPVYSKFYGTWKEIARYPLKIAALLAMTSPEPFVNFGGWVYPIYRYARHDGSYLLNTFYPKEFAKSLASTVDHNLTFANTSLEKRTKIGKPVLALGYFLMSNFFSNDSLSMDQPYIKNIRDQTDFNYNFVAVEVERKPEEGKEIARKFSGTLHQFYSSRGPESVPEFYMYTNDRTVISPPAKSLLYPLTRIRWYSASGGYYYAIKMDYPDDYYDRLKSHSVRQSLESMYYQTMKACIQGSNRNGLRNYFSDNVSTSVFPGFEFPSGIHKSTTDKNKFFASVEQQFVRFYENADSALPEKPDPRACDEALRGQGLLVLAASAINGYYLFDLYDYIEKGY